MRDIIVIGTSTGGIEALKLLVTDLPKHLPASILVVLHTAPFSPNVLDRILGKAGSLPASTATDWQEIKHGHIYVAPADYHLLVERSGHLRVTRGPKENRFRPAVDPLFRSAAYAFGPRVIGVILTGYLDDGAAGLWAVKHRGGAAIVQHPEEAVAASMPINALRHVEVDHCVPLKEIAPLLVRLTGAPGEEKGGQPVSEEMETEVKIAREDNAIESGILTWGEPSLFACPECHGVLMQLKEGDTLRFRCHTGHGYSLESLLSELTEQTEATLWNAVRSIEETVLLMKKLAEQAQGHAHPRAAEAIFKRAADAQARAKVIREAILQKKIPLSAPPGAAE